MSVAGVHGLGFHSSFASAKRLRRFTGVAGLQARVVCPFVMQFRVFYAMPWRNRLLVACIMVEIEMPVQTLLPACFMCLFRRARHRLGEG